MGEETAALLRVLIHKIDNTTFGHNAPTIPQWNGPPHTIVQVQAMLYASLAASLLSAFLAMLGKQWLNQYTSTDIRGTAIERSKNRQRKLDGIVAWYFNYVIESLSLMLQGALLLLGCALTCYLWEINITIAFVILGVTSSGVLFYIFIIAAGATSESCPYQTPGSHAICYLRRVLHSAASAIAPAFGNAFRRSRIAKTIKWYQWCRSNNARPSVKTMVLGVPSAFAIDVYHLGRVLIWPLTVPLVSLACGAANWLCGASSTTDQRLDQQTTMLELRCISWMLQISLDKAIHLSTLEHLATMTVFTGFDPTLIADCFNTFVSCIRVGVNNHEVVIVQGSEQLAMLSAQCFFNTTSHLLVTDPTSNFLKDMRQRYIKIFPAQVKFHGHQSYHTMQAAHCLFVRRQERRSFQWSDYKPSAHEHTIVAHSLVKVAQFKYWQQLKVPRLILRFALHSLSQDPPPPISVIADCLSIIAIDLGCDISDTGAMVSDERYVRIWQVNTTLTLN